MQRGRTEQNPNRMDAREPDQGPLHKKRARVEFQAACDAGTGVDVSGSAGLASLVPESCCHPGLIGSLLFLRL